jgi:hypothetical protein
MGLDMDLYVKKFASNKFGDTSLFNSIQELMPESKNFNDEDDYVSAEIKVQVCYWRKANAIHNFFVNHCADGKDECQEIYVDREDLEKLVEFCTIVLNDAKESEKLLPTVSGFFFGGIEYDDYYFEQLEYTKNKIQKILDNSPESWEFQYRASW